MKIAYLDLNLSYLDEDYSDNPNRYGGGSIIARSLKVFDEFFIFAPESCFDNISQKDRNKCITLTAEQIRDLINQKPILEVEPRFNEFDIILRCSVQLPLNFQGCKAKNVVWSVGNNEQIHQNNKTLLLFNPEQNPMVNLETEIHYFKLGVPIPKYKKYNKKPYLFQCSRHCYEFGSIDAADFCNRNQIRGYFAGPIVPNYPLLEHIDNINTFYLGEISEYDKIEYMKRAQAYITLFREWNPPMNLSFTLANSYNTPIITTFMGFCREYIKEGINGFFVTTEEQLLSAFNKTKEMDQKPIYFEALKNSEGGMILSLFECFKKIVEKS